jgi:peroxiredoxin Q/BCP
MLDTKIPDFTLPATGGRHFNLAAQAGKIVVIYFSPKDSTPGCTTEAQQFRDLHDKAKQELPFDLLSDNEELLCARFAVIKMKSMYGKQVRGIERSTFVIDRDGVLRREWRGVRVPGHAEEVLAFIKTL